MPAHSSRRAAGRKGCSIGPCHVQLRPRLLTSTGPRGCCHCCAEPHHRADASSGDVPSTNAVAHREALGIGMRYVGRTADIEVVPLGLVGG